MSNTISEWLTIYRRSWEYGSQRHGRIVTALALLAHMRAVVARRVGLEVQEVGRCE